MESTYTVLVYEQDDKKPFLADLRALRDQNAGSRIMQRVQRLEWGNFGDHKSLGGGLWELRIDYGPGYRVYYCLEGRRIVLLLCAGDKRDQQADIRRARTYKTNYDAR